MRSRSFITQISIAISVTLACAAGSLAAPKLAILAPDNAETSRRTADAIAEAMDKPIVVLDRDLAESAFRAQTPADPFNMTTVEGRRLGSALGSDFFLVTRAAIQRRISSRRPVYFEAYVIVYLVSTRTGDLMYWNLAKYEEPTAAEAEQKMIADADSIAGSIRASALATGAEEIQRVVSEMEEPPLPDSPLAKNFKAPIPFKRIKPEYTAEAAFYEVAATVEIMIDLDAQGKILRTEITRWAGFGLDQSVERAVREMNWRPAERNGKFLPMRFLVRYNFKKLEKDQ